MKCFSIIVAATSNNGIGRKGDLPWRLALDMIQFQYITSTTTVSDKKNAVIMGRKTYDVYQKIFVHYQIVLILLYHVIQI
jgi:dihydrofolate reductase/thymidylate synthase